jgi:N-acetylneuraminic acid mutarotase
MTPVSKVRKAIPLAMAIVCALPSPVLSEGASRFVPMDWQWGPLFPRPCSAFGCVATGEGVITIGGSYWHAKDGGVAEKTWIPDVYWLGRKTNSWKRLTDFPSAIGQALAVTGGGKIVVVGGRSAERAFAETYWRGAGDQLSVWQRGPDLPRPLFALTGGAVDNTVYAVTDPYATIEPAPEHTEPSTVLAWDISAPNGSWRQVASVPDSEVGFRTTAVADGRIFLFGGAVQKNIDDLQLSDALWILDLKTGAWTRGSKLPYPLRDSTAACVDNRFILLIGGVEDALTQQQSPDGQARIILTNRCPFMTSRPIDSPPRSRFAWQPPITALPFADPK